VDGVSKVESVNGQVEIVFDREIISASDLMREVLERYAVRDFQIKEPDIESVVKKIYNKGLAEE
ncbi:MAG: hypothetical protein BRC30_00760, partial [Nanohaloarchaea archaeon SW_7_46_7]